MTSISTGKSQGQLRRDEAKRRAEQRRRQRLFAQVAALFVAIAIVAVGVWWLVRSDSSTASAGESLYQFDTADFHSLAFDPILADTVYFGHHGGLKVSNDGGENWDDTSLTGVDAMQLGLPTSNPNRRYAAGHDVFYVSGDGGVSWQPQDNDLPGTDLHSFTTSPSDAMRLYASPVGQGLFTSADGGTTWQPIASPAAGGASALVVDPSDPLHVFAGVGNGVSESFDGGVTWQPRTAPSGRVVSLAIAPTDLLTLYAGTDQGVWRQSGDSAWERLSVTTSGAVLALAVNPNQTEQLALVDQEGKYYRSDDAGLTWAER